MLPTPLLLPRTSIGDDVTALLPSIQFDPAMLPPPAVKLPCRLGLPPQHLRAVHWPALLEACADRVAHAIAHPVAMEEVGGVRRVCVMGETLIEQRRDGQVFAYQWVLHPVEESADGAWHLPLPELGEVPPEDGDLDGIPYKQAWISGYLDGLRQALEIQWPSRQDIEPYLDWVRLRLLRQYWTADIQQRVRATIADALALDPAVLRRARRAFPNEDGTPTSTYAYNMALWRHRHWPRLQAESPQWLPLFSQLWRDLPMEGDPIGNLHALLMNEGVTPAMWRLLHREGTAWLLPLRRYYGKPMRFWGQAAIRLLRKAQLFGTSALPPMWMLREVLNLDGYPDRPISRYRAYQTDPGDEALLARLGQWVAEASNAADGELVLAQLRERLHLILAWALAHPDYVRSRAMRHVTLDGLWKRALDWEELRAARARQEPAWPLPFDMQDVVRHGLRLQVLDSRWALLEEGRMMRHCADMYADRCERRRYVMLSVRRVETNARVATVGMIWERGSVQLDQVTGFANSGVSPAVRAIAEEAMLHMRPQAHPMARRAWLLARQKRQVA